MNKLLTIFSDVLGNISYRLANRYTGAGSTILLYVLAEQGVISIESIKYLQNIPNILPFILIGLGLYFLFHIPNTIKSYGAYQVQQAKNKSDIAKYELDYLKSKKEIDEIKK